MGVGDGWDAMGRNTRAAMEIAAGPLSRMMLMDPWLDPVTMAAIVSESRDRDWVVV